MKMQRLARWIDLGDARRNLHLTYINKTKTMPLRNLGFSILPKAT